MRTGLGCMVQWDDDLGKSDTDDRKTNMTALPAPHTYPCRSEYVDDYCSPTARGRAAVQVPAHPAQV